MRDEMLEAQEVTMDEAQPPRNRQDHEKEEDAKRSDWLAPGLKVCCPLNRIG
jgi:hypothetical protein